MLGRTLRDTLFMANLGASEGFDDGSGGTDSIPHGGEGRIGCKTGRDHSVSSDVKVGKVVDLAVRVRDVFTRIETTGADISSGHGTKNQ